MSLINYESFYIIGSESQTIQLILRKNEKININKKYLVSSSSNDLREVIYNKMNFLIMGNTNENTNKNLERVDDPSLINLKNTKANIEYISLSRGGKIMIINHCLYNNIYIKLNYLLAFNNDIELFIDKEKDKKLRIFYFYKELMRRDNYFRNKYQYEEDDEQFCLIKTRSKSNIENENFNEISLLFNRNNNINDLIFISGNKSLFEKRLGPGESFILNFSSLVAFEGSVSIEMVNKRDIHSKGYANTFNYIKIKGPGLIIFEPCQNEIPTDKKKEMLVLVILILSVVFQFILYLILLLY